MARRCRSEVKSCKVSLLGSKTERNAAYPSLHSKNPHLPRRAFSCMHRENPRLLSIARAFPNALLVPSAKRAVASRGKICATLTPVLSAVKELLVHLDLDWGLLAAWAGKRYRRCKTIRPTETVLRGGEAARSCVGLIVNVYLALCPNDDALSTEILPELCKLTRPGYAHFWDVWTRSRCAAEDTSRTLMSSHVIYRQ